MPARCEADSLPRSLLPTHPGQTHTHTHTHTHWNARTHERRFNKYISVAARATRQALKEEQRLAAERRAAVTLKVQHWENGKAGPSVRPTLLSGVCLLLLLPLTRFLSAGVDRQARRRAALNPPWFGSLADDGCEKNGRDMEDGPVALDGMARGVLPFCKTVCENPPCDSPRLAAEFNRRALRLACER